jgi:hypothetical protein
MKFATILVTRNKSCHVKTLHSILRFNLKCLQNKYQNEIVFVNDDSFDKADTISNFIKSHERLLFVDYGIQIDDDSLNICFNKLESVGCLVFPGVLEGIDWGLFKAKVKDGCKEPTEQIGLHFDTEVSNKISSEYYNVKKTSSKCWLLISKNVIKHLKDKKSSSYKIFPRMETMFSKFQESGIKIIAYPKAKLTMTYNHECVSNILNTAGIKSN